MIVGRILYGGSKLALSNQLKNTALWELCGVEGKVDVDLHCYLPMDRLLERQSAIQRTLAARHLQDGHLVLYDITSNYFEGAYTQSDLVTFGYNRDGKRGHEQMVIAFLCSAEGCSVGAEVFAGIITPRTSLVKKMCYATIYPSGLYLVSSRRPSISRTTRAAQAHEEIVRHLCAELTEIETVFPGTDLRLVYEISGSS
jgi:hypothetical protein